MTDYERNLLQGMVRYAGQATPRLAAAILEQVTIVLAGIAQHDEALLASAALDRAIEANSRARAVAGMAGAYPKRLSREAVSEFERLLASMGIAAVQEPSPERQWTEGIEKSIIAASEDTWNAVFLLMHATAASRWLGRAVGRPRLTQSADKAGVWLDRVLLYRGANTPSAWEMNQARNALTVALRGRAALASVRNRPVRSSRLGDALLHRTMYFAAFPILPFVVGLELLM